MHWIEQSKSYKISLKQKKFLVKKIFFNHFCGKKAIFRVILDFLFSPYLRQSLIEFTLIIYHSIEKTTLYKTVHSTSMHSAFLRE